MESSKLFENSLSLIDKLDHPIFEIVAKVAAQENTPIYVIGGYVRDLLLGRPSKDIDFVVKGSGIETAKKVAQRIGKVKVSYFKNFGTAMLNYKGVEIEFVGARKESYQRDSRKPIVEDGTLQDDQDRRDFTINALAISMNKADYGKLIDPFSGLSDLENKTIVTPLDPDITYSDDPLRMMRAIRFATQLNFFIEKKSLEAIKKNKDRINIVSKERVSDELNKIILSPKPSIGFKLLESSGLLKIIFPEMVDLMGVEERNGLRHKDNFYHTLKVLDNVAEKSNDLWLRWSAILHDIAKPATKRFDNRLGWTFHGHDDKGARMVPKIFKKLKLPLDAKMRYVQKLVALHLRPIALTQEVATDSAVRRLLYEAGEHIDDLMILCRADITSKNEYRVKKYRENYERVVEKMKQVEEKDRLRNWQPPISGELIMSTFDILPCKEVGIIKKAIRESILEGETENNYNAALEYMIKKGGEMGLSKK